MARPASVPAFLYATLQLASDAKSQAAGVDTGAGGDRQLHNSKVVAPNLAPLDPVVHCALIPQVSLATHLV